MYEYIRDIMLNLFIPVMNSKDLHSLLNVKVVLKVQHFSRVGGMIDHPSWDKSSYKHSYNIKEITSYSNYNKYVLKGDDALY